MPTNFCALCSTFSPSPVALEAGRKRIRGERGQFRFLLPKPATNFDINEMFGADGVSDIK